MGTRGGHHYPKGIILEWFSQGWGWAALHLQGSISPLVKWGWCQCLPHRVVMGFKWGSGFEALSPVPEIYSKL